MEFYIKSIGDPNFNPDKLDSSSEISRLLTQIETLLFTRKGEVLGQTDFGVNLEDYIYSFQYNDYLLKGAIDVQLSKYVPLAAKYNTTVDVKFTEESTRHVALINVTIDSKYQIGVFV